MCLGHYGDDLGICESTALCGLLSMFHCSMISNIRSMVCQVSGCLAEHLLHPFTDLLEQGLACFICLHTANPVCLSLLVQLNRNNNTL